jgi:tetratricopeptide (TPR) repeat protein
MRTRVALALALTVAASTLVHGETESERGRRLFAQGDYAGAARVLQLLSIKGETAEAEEVLLATAYWRLGDKGRARAALSSAAGRFPDGALVPLALGEMDFEQGRYEAAYADFSLASGRSSSAEAHAGMVAALINLGVERYGNGDADGASESLGRALRLDPGSVEALKNLALVRIESGRAVDALPLLERAVAAAPSDLSAWKTLAGAAETAGSPVQIERALRRWADLAPLDAAPVAALGRLLESEGREAEAGAAYARAAELGSDDPRVHYA